MRIALLGIRGIPANYGGFETFAEELSIRLVKKGHHVTVYGRSNIIDYKEKKYKGVTIILLPTISHKYLDTVAHTFLSVIHTLFKRYDVILVCNAANSVFTIIPRLFGRKVVVNVDGIERKRKKWNALGKLWYLFGEFFSVLFPNRIVTDAKTIQEYYKKRYKKSSVMIPYGADIESIDTNTVLQDFNLLKDEYILYVSRLEPENNAHIVIQAFENVKTGKKLVIVGDAPYAADYINELKSTNDKRVVFTGFVFGKGYKEFQSNAYLYVHATDVGGTHPALIESMGFGNCVVVNGTKENIEVIGDAGIIYKKNDIEDLTENIQMLIDNPELRAPFCQSAKERVSEKYSWDTITEQYENLFKELLDN